MTANLVVICKIHELLQGLVVLIKRLLQFVASAALLFVLAAAACGDDDDKPVPSPTSPTPGGSAATPTAPAAAFPMQVTDLLGRKVEIKAKPATVVTLSPTATELVYAVGGTVVGRTSSVDYPEAAKQAKDVGTAYQPNAEIILGLKPDLIVADSVIQAQPDLRKAIEGFGAPVVFIGAESYQQVLDGLALMGKILDAGMQAQNVSAQIEKALADAKAALAGKQASAVLLISDRDRTLYAAKPSSYAGDIMSRLGLTNPAGTQPDSGPFPGYTAVPPEKLVEFNPDFIFTITPAPPPAPRLSSMIPSIPPFKGLKAVTGNHVVEVDVQVFLQAPGPRIVDAFKAITAAATKN